MVDYRNCAGSQHFNTGVSKCPIDPDKIKGIILVQHGYKLPTTLTAEALKEACHADKPARLLPIKNIVEYATSGGEAQVSAVGYGPNRVTGYSARTDTFTVGEYDMALRANLANAKNVAFDMYAYDANNIIYGCDDGTENLAGIELSGVYPGGQEWDSSGTEANLTVNVMFKDVEKYMKNADAISVDFDVDNAVEGLVYVDLVETSTNGSYKLIEHFGHLDVTSYYGEALASAAATAIIGATSATYDSANVAIAVVGTPTGLAAPSVLFGNDIEGIEGFA